jgi:hypothetical protein
MATRIYLLLVNHPTSLIGPTKSNPHFIYGSLGKVITNLAKFCMAKPPTFWHASQDLQNSKASWNNFSHQYPASRIFLAMMSATK